jgi:predicted Na+-dependent transporter
MAILIVNLITFIINKTSGNVNQTVVIVVISIVAGLILIPLIVFFLFHLYLTFKKKTTR